MSGLGGLGLSLNFGGSDSNIISEDTVITVGSAEFPTFADAWQFAKSSVISSGSMLVIQLPDTAGVPFLNAFSEEIIDRDYGQVLIRGATKASGAATAIAGFGGVAGAFTLTFTVPGAVATAAGIHGFMLVEGAIRPTTENNSKVHGYHRVTGTTATTVTVEITSQDAMTAPTFVANAYICTVFTSMFKATDQMWGIKGTRAVLPIFRDVSFIGGRYDPGYAPSESHRAVYMVDGSGGQTASVSDPTTLATTDPMITFACHGFRFGLSMDSASWTGAFAVSSMTQWGVAVNSGGELYATQAIVTGCQSFGFGVENSNVTVSPYAVWRPTIISGHTGNGARGFSLSFLKFQFGAVIGNVGTDCQANFSSQFKIGVAADLTLGTVSPAVNTLGNNNAYIGQ